MSKLYWLSEAEFARIATRLARCASGRRSECDQRHSAAIGTNLPVVGWAEQVRSAQVVQTSTCSAMARASSTSMPRYLTVLSILVWPSRICTARRLPVRR
jgi:hypothetical protein